MDRQTRIAFGLIFLLLIAYFAYMSRFSPKEQSTAGQGDSLVTAEARPPVPDEFTSRAAQGELQETAAPPELEPQRVEFANAPRREIVVETDHALYRLDSRGAVLTQIKLLDFKSNGNGDDFVELIGPREGENSVSVLALDLQGPGGYISSAEWGFQVEVPGGTDSLHLSGNAEETIVFRAQDGHGGKLRKSFTFFGDRFEFLLQLDCDLEGGLAGTKAVAIDWSSGILSTEKNRKDDLHSFNNNYLVGDNNRKRSLNNFKGSNGLTERGDWSEEGSIQWVATKSKYFLAALVPDQLMSGNAILVGDHAGEYLGWRVEYPLRGGRSSFSEEFKVYTGPLVYKDLKKYGRGLEKLVDMGKLIRPISLVIKWLMDFLSRFIPNYGLIIILMSILTKVAFYQLTHKSFKSMKDMQALQPELKGLQEKYKNNKEQLNKATMELYKKHGVNPLGGCLPLLLQMPVFFALYRVLRAAVELRGAGFIAWIDDLSYMDVIYRFPFDIPLLGGFIENSISVLPILMGLSMWVQQKLGGSGMGMGGGSPAAGQMAAMNKIMPIFMTFIFYRMPSGLVLYWLVNNILTAAQQYYIHKGQEETPEVVTAKA